MKNIKSILITCLIALVTLSSCDETLDINTDPLAATTADPNGLFPYIFATYTARNVTELGTRICDVSQYISNTFNSPKNGTTSSFLTGNTWGMYYSNVLASLKLVATDAENAGPTSNNINAAAKIFSAHIYLMATSLWEDIPFSEAIQSEVYPFPAYDAQKDVLYGIVDLLDEALVLIDNMPSTGNYDFANGDKIFGGDVSKWAKFGNSYKLRTLMMLRGGGENVDAQITQALSRPLMTDNSDAAYISYTGDPGGENAMATIISTFFGSAGNEAINIFGPGDPIDELLSDSGDPRWQLWVARGELDAPGNAIFPNPNTSVLSNNIIRTTLPDVLMTPAEIDLYKAELAFDGLSAAGSAEANYKNGVRNAIKWWGQDIDDAQLIAPTAIIDSYVNSLATPSADDIYNQQYLAAFMMPVMAWNQVRRNQVPFLTAPPASSITSILKRFTYSVNEVGSNPNTPANKNADEPMWFEN